MRVRCWPLRLAFSPVLRMMYPSVLHRLAREWPAAADFRPGSSVHVMADLGPGGCPSALEFCPVLGPEGVSYLLDAVQARLGLDVLDFGRILRRRWMGRKIAFESVPA